MDTFEQMVTVQLDNILSSEGFASAPQLRQFLTFVVNSHLQNKTKKIDAYSIATQALGRPVDFAPDLDPIVRVQAANLRQRLDLYNASVGVSDPIKITLPRGGYSPVIEKQRESLNVKIDPGPVVEMGERIRKSPVLPTIIVEKFECDGSLFCGVLSEKIYSDLILALNRFDTVNVIPALAGEKQRQGGESGYNYRLYGNCRIEDGVVYIGVFLVNIVDGVCIYSKEFKITDAEDPCVARAALISEIASSIGEISGAIYKNVEEQISTNGLDSEDAFGLIACIFRSIRPPIPTTSGHLYRGIRPPVARCFEAFGFCVS